MYAFIVLSFPLQIHAASILPAHRINMRLFGLGIRQSKFAEFVVDLVDLENGQNIRDFLYRQASIR